MLPLLIFASARAGLAFTPINYRLSAEGIQTLSGGCPNRWWSSTAATATCWATLGQHVIDSDEFLTAAA